MITCTVCGYDKNPNASDFCDACGAELGTTEETVEELTDNSIIDIPTPHPPPVEDTFVPDVTPSEPEPISPASIPTPISNIPQPTITVTTARLIAKQFNAPIPEFPIDGTALIGIFDPDMGPVDVDLEDFVGNETVSRHHAEIYQDAGVWKIKDLGSTNGVFIKPMGQTRFGARITTPESLTPGDELAIAKIRFLFQSP